MKKEFYVYVIGLKPQVAKTKAAKKQNPNCIHSKNKKYYYVGYSSKTPEELYHQHIAGYINEKGHKIYSSKVYNYGYKKNGLRPRQYNGYKPTPTKDEAMKIEVELAGKLRGKGHCAY